MNRTAKWQLTLGLVAVAAMAGAAQPAAASPAADLNFTIHVRNYAGVDSKTLAQAEKVTSRIFQKAGVISQWADAPLQEQEYTADPQWAGLSHIWVNIMPAAMSEKLHLADSMTGLAPGAGPDRVLAYIFYNRVQEMQREQSAAFERKNTEFTFYVADLLGSAMAHEVGHILLNLAVHSKTGIMRGNWDPVVLRDMISGYLYFTKDQEKIMQAEVTRRARQQGVLEAAGRSETLVTTEQAR